MTQKDEALKIGIDELERLKPIMKACTCNLGGVNVDVIAKLKAALSAPTVEHDNEVIEKCAIRGRLAQLENKVVDIEIRALKQGQPISEKLNIDPRLIQKLII